jgi:phage shock protein E
LWWHKRNKEAHVQGVIIAAVIGIVGVLGVAAISSNGAGSPETTGFSAVQTDIESGAKLYDVRTEQEYAAGHFEDAENWSLQDMQAGKLPDVAKDTELYVYCRSGNRSAEATTILENAGFTNVTDLGGLQDVQDSGGTLQQS